MHVVFKDIHDNNNNKIEKGKIAPLTLSEILYADDILLIAKDTNSMNFLIQQIEKESN